MIKINAKAHSLTKYFCVFAAIVVIDQLYEYKIRQIGGFYVCNRGISFNIQIRFLFYWLFSLLACLAGFFYIQIKNSFQLRSLFKLGLALFFAGALSNLLDRFFYGCVTDYFAFFQPIFPIFNLADFFISAGALAICIVLLPRNPHKSD